MIEQDMIKKNRVLIDFDYIFEKDIVLFNDIINKKIDCDDSAFMYYRTEVDENINPLIMFDDDFNGEDNDIMDIYRNTYISPETPVAMSTVSYIIELYESGYCDITFACYNQAEAIYLEWFFKDKVKRDINVVYKKDNILLNVSKYDTIYIRHRGYLRYFNFDEIERRSIYVSNLRCNFVDDKKEVLHPDFFLIGLKNDVMVTFVYLYNTKEDVKEN